VKAQAARPLVSATGVLTLAAIVGKPITFAREIAVARTFGASAGVDFVLLAQLVPLVLVTLVSQGVVYALPSAFRRVVDSHSSANAASATLELVRRVLIAAALALFVGAALTSVALMNHTARVPLAPVLILVLGITAALECATTLYSQLLWLMGRFGRSAIQSTVNGAVTVGVIAATAGPLGIWAWPLGLFVDALWQMAFLYVAVRRYRPSGRPAPAIWQRGAWRTVWPSITLASLTFVYAATDRAAGLLAGVGVLAIWTWSLKFNAATVGVTALPVASVTFSRGHTLKSREARLYGVAWVSAVVVSAVAVGLFAIFGADIVRFLFASRHLSRADTSRLVYLSLFAVAAAVPLAMYTISSRALMAAGRFKAIVLTSLVGAILYPVVVFVGLPGLNYRALGIAYLSAASVIGALATWSAVASGLLTFPTRSPESELPVATTSSS
jgi:putative peptidoglycan lipid II flippase